MAYQAPYLLNTELVPIPTEGTFLLPVCTTAERLAKILSALYYGGLNISSEGDMSHLVDVLDAIGKIRPECELEPTGCTTFVSAQDRITYFPALDASDLPLGYLTNSWTKITGDNPIVGLKTGDIITDIAHMPLLPTVWDHLHEPSFILLLGYPSISITGLVGAGTLRVYMLNILLGGKAIVVKDNNIFSIAFLDTNLDTASLPPETYVEHLIEAKFEGAGEHRLDIVFVPSVSADIEFLGFGGGIRKVEICGFEENTMPENCCDETNDLLRSILKVIEGGFKIVPMTQDLPSDFTVDCTPSGFDGDEGDAIDKQFARYQSLCLTVERYIAHLMFKVASDLNMSVSVRDTFYGYLTFPPNPAIFMRGAHFAPTSGITIDDVTKWIEQDAWKTAVCALVNGLSGKTTTWVNFQNALADFDTSGIETSLLHFINYLKTNQNIATVFEAFAKELDKSMDVVTSEEYICSCTAYDEECSPADFDFIGLNGTVVTRLTIDTWNVTQINHVPEAPASRKFTAQWRDRNWRCFNFFSATNGSSRYDNIGCNGARAEGTGGGTGDMRQAGFITFEQNGDPLLGINMTIYCICASTGI